MFSAYSEAKQASFAGRAKQILGTASGMVLAVALAACSQAMDSPEAGGPTAPPPPAPPPPPPPSSTDTTPPTVNFAVSSATIAPGTSIDLIASATDNVDGDINVILACDGGSLTDSRLSLSLMTNLTSITCTAEATDAAGNRSVETQDIAVQALPVTVSALSGEGIILPGQTGVLVVENLLLTEDRYVGLIDGTSIDVTRIGEDILAFGAPTDAMTGQTLISIEVDGQILEFELEIVAPTETIDDPEVFVRTVFEDTLPLFDDLIADPGGEFSPSQVQMLQDQRDELEQTLGALDSFSEEDLLEIATILQANGVSDMLSGASQNAAQILPVGSFDQSGVVCNEARLFTISLVITVANIAGIVAATPATPLFIAGFLISARETRDLAGQVPANCLSLDSEPEADFFSLPQADPNPIPFDRSLAVVSAEAADRLQFTEGVPRGFSVVRVRQLQEEIQDSYLSDLQRFINAVRPIPIIPSSFISTLEGFQEPIEEEVTFGDVVIAEISNANISSTLLPDGDDFSVEFVFDGEAEEESLDFSFELQATDDGGATEFLEATLDLTPTVPDIEITVEQGLPTMSQIDVSAFDSVRVSGQPDLGSVRLEQDGRFTYTPVADFFGLDAFEVIGSLNGLDSDPGTVFVDIVRVFEGSWDLVIDTTQNDPEDICGGTGSFRTNEIATVERLSDLDYRVTYQQIGSTVISLDSIDDPDGLSFSGVVEEQDGTITNLSFSIPNSRRLSGNSTYRFEDEDTGQVCTGRTTFTGSK